MLKVCKFGGTSLSDGSTFKLVKNIILSDESRKVIVVSAPGKRFCGDLKVTDILINAAKSFDKKYYINKAASRFEDIVLGLQINFDVKKHFDITNFTPEYLISRGEYINAKILAEYLGYDFYDAYDLLYFKNALRLNCVKTKKAFRRLNLDKGVVIPGFYYNEEGNVKLFCRGGSDITGAYAAKYLKADVYENFSDISGIASVNPKLVKTPPFINDLSFKDFKNLDALDPNVFEKSAYKPVIGTKTEIFIKNTFNPCDRGTRIGGKVKYKKQVYISVANDKNKVVVTGRNIKVKDFLKAVAPLLSRKGLTYTVVLKNRKRIELLFTAKNPYYESLEKTAERAVIEIYNELFTTDKNRS